MDIGHRGDPFLGKEMTELRTGCSRLPFGQVRPVVLERDTATRAVRLEERGQWFDAASEDLCNRRHRGQAIGIDQDRLISIWQPEAPISRIRVRVLSFEETGDRLLLQPFAGV